MTVGGPASDRFCARQSVGQRDHQEDDYGFLDARRSADESEHTLIVVADGMGGHANGGRASEIVAEAFIDAYQHSPLLWPERLDTALRHANQCIAAAIETDATLGGMGTTLLAVVVHEGVFNWISVGDSPFWLFRDGQLQQMNADHSMAPLLRKMAEDGRISAEEAAIDPRRNSLLSALMGRGIELVDMPPEPLPCFAGDVLVLASDGLQTLSDEEISSILAGHSNASVGSIGDALIRAVDAKQHPGQDNTTVVVYRPAGVAEAPEKEQADVTAREPEFGIKQVLIVTLVLLALVGLVYLFSLPAATG